MHGVSDQALPRYSRLPIEEYIAECYARACRVASMLAMEE